MARLKQILIIYFISLLAINGAYSQRHVFIVKKDKFGLIDNNGKLVIALQFDSLKQLNGLLAFLEKRKWGLITPYGKRLLDSQFQDIRVGEASEFLLVKKNNKWAKCSWDGKIISPFQYDDGAAEKLFDTDMDFSAPGDTGVIMENGLYGLKWDGVVTIPPKYQMVRFETCYVQAKANNKWGVISVEDKMILPFEYDEISYVDCEYAVVKKIGWGAVDLKTKNALVDFNYQKVRSILVN